MKNSIIQYENVQSQALSVEIAETAGESEIVYLRNSRLLGLITPVLETGTVKLGFLASSDGVTWTTQYISDQYGNYFLTISDPTKTCPISIDLSVMYPWSFLKLVTLDSAGAVKIQTAKRTFTFLYGP